MGGEADNFHYYEDKRSQIESIASVTDYIEIPYTYNKTFSSLEEFDGLVGLLENEESKMVLKDYQYRPELFQDEFFKDWYNMLCKRNCPNVNMTFANEKLASGVDISY